MQTFNAPPSPFPPRIQTIQATTGNLAGPGRAGPGRTRPGRAWADAPADPLCPAGADGPADPLSPAGSASRQGAVAVLGRTSSAERASSSLALMIEESMKVHPSSAERAGPGR